MNKYLAMWMLPLGMAAGCATTEPARVEGRVNPYQEKGRIQWNSRNLKHVLSIDAADTDRLDSGLLRVRLAIRNKTRKDIWVDIRTLYTDEQGFEKERTNWEAVMVPARTHETYEALSLGADVHDYQVIIRDAKDFMYKP